MHTFRVKRHMSKFMISLRFIDAAIVPGVLFVLARAKGYGWDASLNLLGILGMLMAALSMEAAGLYRAWRSFRLRAEVHALLLAWTFVVGGILIVTSVIPTQFRELPSELLVQWLVLTPGTIAGTHALGRALLHQLRKGGYNTRTAVIAGAGAVGEALVRKLSSASCTGIDLAGFFDDDPKKQGRAQEGVRVLGTLDELVEYVKANSVDLVYLALPMRAEQRMRKLLNEINESTRAAVYMVPDIFVFDLLGSRLHDLDGIPMVSLSESPQIGPAGTLKRLEDLILATVGLVLLSPVFLLVSALVKRSSPGPVFFGHERVGQHGRKFTCYKFRTMVPDAAEVLAKL
ncbi:MAG: sugar transferase, partial [Deltaproteobacteria bacterium]|nr:sugar transferase [Deltaproteobacteria bacterium]